MAVDEGAQSYYDELTDQWVYPLPDMGSISYTKTLTQDVIFPTAPDDPPRKEVLLESINIITGDRNNSYGPPTQDFRRSADAMSAMGYGKLDACTGKFKPLAPSDIAILVIMIKISRLQHSPKKDNWVDIGGYTGCGYECSLEEQDETE